MDPVIGSVIITLIQTVAELAKQQGMTKQEADQHFMESWKKVEDRPASDLPDV